MGHIITDDSDISYYSELVYDIKDNGISIEKIENIIDKMIPRDEEGNLLVRYIVRQKGRNTAIFLPKYHVIEVSVDRLKEWLEINSKDLAKMFKVENDEIFRGYLILMVLSHEVEHAYQYLIGFGKVDAPCKMIQQGYKTLFDVMVPKEYILPRPVKEVRNTISLICYKRRENEFLLERNAQFDSLDMISKIASYNGHEEIGGMFDRMRNIFGTVGYTDNKDGALINTFRDILIGDKLRKLDNDYEGLDMEERYKLGLPIDEETRKKVLAYKK